MRLFSILIIVLFFSACSSSKKTPTTSSISTNDTRIEPGWLKSRPITSVYYIGISRVSKKSFPNNYAEQAKKMALEDLSQEIEVRVQANSILYTFERNDSYKEDFVQSIKLESSLELENYELVELYETESEYALYYRLNKAEYLERKKALEKKQIEIAKSWLDKANELNQNELVKELEYKLNAMESIKDYWNEPLKTQVEGKEIFFGNHLFQSLQASFNKMEMKMNTERLSIPYGIPLPKNKLVVSVSSKGKALNGIPMQVKAVGISLGYNQYTSNAIGQVSISKVKGNKPMEVNLKVIPDLDRLSAVSDQVKEAVLRGVKLPEARCIVQIYTPKVNIKISRIGNSILANLQWALSGMALLNENDKFKADLLCTIKLSAREGGEYNGLFTTFLDAEIIFVTQTGIVFYSQKFSNIKGVDLSFDRGINKALESLKTKFTHEVVPQLKKKLKS